MRKRSGDREAAKMIQRLLSVGISEDKETYRSKKSSTEQYQGGVEGHEDHY